MSGRYAAQPISGMSGCFGQTSDMTWRQSIVVSALPDEPSVLHCEPEGAELQIEPGDQVTITFAGPMRHGFEISWAKDGLLLCRLGDSDVEIADRRGRDLHW